VPVGLQAIYSKTLAARLNVTVIQADTDKALTSYGLAVAAKMAEYPAQIPPISVSVNRRGRATVRRSGAKPYRRTGDYGRFWTAPGALRVKDGTLTLVNRVQRKGNSYGVYVGGPKPGAGPGHRQAIVMGKRNWPSITDVSRALAKDFRPIINRAVAGRPS
jgi:hypothetical protein